MPSQQCTADHPSNVAGDKQDSTDDNRNFAWPDTHGRAGSHEIWLTSVGVYLFCFDGRGILLTVIGRLLLDSHRASGHWLVHGILSCIDQALP